MQKSIAVIGGGLIGLATAYALQNHHKGVKIHLFEKEVAVGMHQSGRNSGVLHCGLNYEPGSLKAKLAVDGIRSMTKFCIDHEIDHEICGKVVVATKESQIKTLHTLADRGERNGLKGLKLLTDSELRSREPYVRAKSALLVPEEGIVDYKSVMRKLADIIQQNGGEIHLNAEVIKVDRKVDGTLSVHTKKFETQVDFTVSCAGLQSDQLYSTMTKLKRPLRIVPFRGEYMELKDEAKHLVNHLVYPAPDIRFPFLGVHFTRMINGAREVGPNAVLAMKREGYKNSDFNLRDVLDSSTHIGLIRFLSRNLGFSVKELSSSLFESIFISKAQELIPFIDSSMIKKGNAGVRAQAVSNDGKLLWTFILSVLDNKSMFSMHHHQVLPLH
jgi:(S)-2-hydroxyglutarate dehydrogenase